MKSTTTQICLLLWCFLTGSTLPLNAQSNTHGAIKTKAVIVGISHYQDADIPDLKLAHHDAEAFAAFLRSEAGGGLSESDYILLTNEEATNARFAAALDWLFEHVAGGQAIIYFAGYGDVKPGSAQFPGFLLLNDATLSPILAGAFNFPAYLDYHANGSKAQSIIIANTYPLLLPENRMQHQFMRNYQAHTTHLDADFTKNLVESSTFQSTSNEIARSKISLNNMLLDGLLGMADRNGNEVVTMRELVHFINKQKAAPETWPTQLSINYDGKDKVISKVDKAALAKLRLLRDGMFPSIVHLETSEIEDDLFKKLGDHERQLYQDFVIAIKLGRLLEPASHCAASLYDSLTQIPGLSPIFGNMRRNLAAALQDEVQQALNAYLRSDIREIERRKNDKRYRLYPRYLELAGALLGEKHYLHPLLMLKKLYFQGLLHRFEGEQQKDTSLLMLALENQQLALAIEPEAAFVVNEMGVIYSRLGQLEQSLEQFQLAAAQAPNWSMPQSNLCHSFRLAGDYDNALIHGDLAIQFSPGNVMAINNLGLVRLEMGQTLEAEGLFVHAISMDSNYPESYFNLALLKASQGQHEISLEWLRQSLQKGFDDWESITFEKKLIEVRQMPTFADLIRSYFPDK